MSVPTLLSMYSFTNKVEIPAGSSLAGYGDRISSASTRAAVLEVHGFGDEDSGWEICSVDSLYAGVLAKPGVDSGLRRVITASHTHFAPMLDAAKPDLGIFSRSAAQSFMSGIEKARRGFVSPDTCTTFSGDVNIPVYRRFDFPENRLNRLLTKYLGFYPNERHPVDRSVKIFIFSRDNVPEFAIAYHECHPVTRADAQEVSADYVQALREAIRERFRVTVCLFFLGCAGDIRPNLAKRRSNWLPKNRLNWRFKYPPTSQDEAYIDDQYRNAVRGATQVDSFPITAGEFQLVTKKVKVEGVGLIDVPQLRMGEILLFSFLPFEVSHRYHLDALEAPDLPRSLIVSCAGDTKVYLPHPSQIPFGGYEVDSSRACMGLSERVELPVRSLR
jgi:hypothetical protein